MDFDALVEKYKKLGIPTPSREMIKTPEQIQGIKEAGIINTKVLDYVEQHIRVGMSTEEIDQLVAQKRKSLVVSVHLWAMRDFLKVYVPASMIRSVMAYLMCILFEKWGYY